VNVFVTGGTGFVGAHLVKALRARGDTVTALVRQPALAARLGWVTPSVWCKATWTMRPRCGRAAPARRRVPCGGKDRGPHAAEFMATNRDGTANVLEAARDAGARRFLFVSSLAVAGPTTPGHPIDETRPPQPVTTTAARSTRPRSWSARCPPPCPWTIVRPPVVYGEWDRGTVKIFQLARRGVVPVFGDGSQELSVIHAEDLARSLIAAATSPAASGRVYFRRASGHDDQPCARACGRAGPGRTRAMGRPGATVCGAWRALGGWERLRISPGAPLCCRPTRPTNTSRRPGRAAVMH